MSVRAIVALSEWTRQQGGMVTAAQAESAGVTRLTLHSLVRSGALERVRRGAYKLAGAPWSRNDEVRAVWLQSEPGALLPAEREAVVSHQTAASVYGFGVVFPPAIQVTLAHARRTRQPGVRFYLGEVADPDVEWVDHMRVTRPARIISDLFADGFGDLEQLGSIAADAIHAGKLTVAELAEVCAPYAVRYGLPPGDGHSLVQVMLDGFDAPASRAA